jgi:ABC-type glycerol-3-phosphate transport system substrate-binding protein
LIEPEEFRRPVKKLHAGFTAILLVTLLISSCQSALKPSEATPASQGTAQTTAAVTSAVSASPTPSGTATSIPQLNVQPETLKGKVVRFYHPWNGAVAGVVDQAVADFNQKNPYGIKVEVTEPGSSQALVDTIEPLMGSADSPNLIVAPVEAIHHLQDRHHTFIALDDYVNDPTWGFSEEDRASFTTLFWDQDKMTDGMYGIPAERNFAVLFYNQTWARELGFNDAPTTAEEFRAQACAAAKAVKADTNKDNDGTGGWMINTDALTVASWLNAFGVDSFIGSADNQYHFDTAASRSAFQFLRSMFDDSCAWVSRLASPYDYFATRQALFYSGSTADIAQQKAALERVSSGDEWYVLSYPLQAGSSNSNRPSKPVILASGSSYAILASEKEDQLAAWLLLRWLSQPEYQAAIAKAGSSVPVGFKAVQALSGAEPSLSDAEQQNPQWAQTFQWAPTARSAPVEASWYVVQNILEDAFWQSMQSSYITPEMVPGLLTTLDATIPEVLKESN